jgi:hypothetical protein
MISRFIMTAMAMCIACYVSGCHRRQAATIVPVPSALDSAGVEHWLGQQRRLSWAPRHVVGQGRSRPELRFDPTWDGFSLSLRPCGRPVSALILEFSTIRLAGPEAAEVLWLKLAWHP